MSVFQKRATTREVNIFGEVFTVDFGKDDLVVIFQQVNNGLEGILKESKGDLTETEKLIRIQEEEKALLKIAIAEIIGCGDRMAESSFHEDSLVLLREVYAYLAMEYISLLQAKSPYSIERIAGYESFN